MATSYISNLFVNLFANIIIILFTSILIIPNIYMLFHIISIIYGRELLVYAQATIIIIPLIILLIMIQLDIFKYQTTPSSHDLKLIAASISKILTPGIRFSQVITIRVLLAHHKDTLPICFASISPQTAKRITMRYSENQSNSKKLTMTERISYWASATEKELEWLHIWFLKPMVVIAFYLPEPNTSNKMIRFPQEIFPTQFYKIINVK